MNRPLLTAAVAAAAVLAGCVPRSEPPPAPAPPPPPPPPSEPAAPPPADWEDSPLSPGDWSYHDDDGVTWAAYGTGAGSAFILRCERSREISLIRAGEAANALIVRTSFRDRSLPAVPGHGGLVARVAASDPLLDEIAFSRGRFAVEAQGTPRLILPTWPEPAHVIEDCRG